MGATQSVICRKEQNNLNLTTNQIRDNEEHTKNMVGSPIKANISNTPSANKANTKNKLTAKFRSYRNKFIFKPNEPDDTSHKDGKYDPAASYTTKPPEEHSTFRWTLSSDFDADLVSSFDRVDSVKSINYEEAAHSRIVSLERLSPLARLGSDIITTFRKSLSLAEAECQGALRGAHETHTTKETERTFVPVPEKHERMDVDLASSRTSSTDLSEGSTSAKRHMDKYEKTSTKTTYVSTTATTNGTDMADVPSEKRATISPDYHKHEGPCDHAGHERKLGAETATQDKLSSVATFFKMNGVNELFEKPDYNSLCTKCMHKDDKLPKGYKGMIIDFPKRNADKPKDKSPYLDRSNIVVQTALVGGRSIDQVYEIAQDKLGKGSYGNVLKGVHRETGAERAVKIIRKAKIENAMRMRREIQIMKSLDHPNIIKLFEVYEDAECLYLVMDMCTGGELFDRIVQKGSFSENYAAFIMRQVFSAIAYCHNKNVLHRDLKPENILYSNDSNTSPVKIIDWGFATKCFRSHKFTSLVGTPYYVAPEVLLGNYDKACDIWSAGVILFILLVGYPPFHGSDNAEILKNVKRGWIKFIPKHWSHVSAAAKDLITRCLSYIPKKRITAEEALGHEWILKCTSLPPTVAPNVSKSLARRFRNFLKFNKFKQMALTCIAYHLSEKELAPLTSAFEALDRDRDGVLSLSEVADGLQQSQQTDSTIEKLVKGLDTDQSGIIGRPRRARHSRRPPTTPALTFAQSTPSSSPPQSTRGCTTRTTSANARSTSSTQTPTARSRGRRRARAGTTCSACYRARQPQSSSRTT